MFSTNVQNNAAGRSDILKPMFSMGGLGVFIVPSLLCLQEFLHRQTHVAITVQFHAVEEVCNNEEDIHFEHGTGRINTALFSFYNSNYRGFHKCVIHNTNRQS